MPKGYVYNKVNFTSSPPETTSNLKKLLPNYLNYDDGAYRYEFTSSKFDEVNKVTTDIYTVYSQKWPLEQKEYYSQNLWHHKLIIYKPETVLHKTALLYVVGGYSADNEGKAELMPPAGHEQLDFANIAQNNKAIVSEIQNVPNQFLSFEGEEKPKKEDEIIAYSYKKFLGNPEENIYLPAHLPMAKAVCKAMDTIQTVMLEENNFTIDDFVLSGASKRAWAAWLATACDERVSAIIPVVLDILNVEESLKSIVKTYSGKCPPALGDYVAAGVIAQLDTPNFDKLMEIEDPLTYAQDPTYKDRLSIPKLIINSSGDDFFAPDSSSLYFSVLPGESNLLRYLPNSPHYFNKKIVGDALNDYFGCHLNNIAMPKVTWSFTDHSIDVTASHAPTYAKLWRAENPDARDFRFNKYPNGEGDIKYVEYYLPCKSEEGIYKVHAEFPDNTDLENSFELYQGWQAAFVELGFDLNGHNMIVTTGVNITPDSYDI
jgi:PhoPQ-activated pathogenicity-related protein